MTCLPHHRGYIALISVLAISFMLMTFAILASENGFRTRTNTTALEDRLAAAHHARTCSFLALLLLAQDESYHSTDMTVWFSSNAACTISNAIKNDMKANTDAGAQVGTSMSAVHAEAAFASTSIVTVTKWFEM
jgi:hypothetical protein